MSKLNLSVCLLALNEAQHIGKALKSVKSWAQEIIVVIDDLTTDNTAQLAKKYTDKVYKQKHYDNFHINKQYALNKATQPWILWLDADEKITKNLKLEIERKVKKEKNPYNGYFIPRKNIIFNKWIRYTGWYPDHQLRLFKNGQVKFPCQRIHEHPQVNPPLGYLKNPLIHYNYQTVTQFVEKMNRYTSTDAKNFAKEFQPPYYQHFITRPINEFIKRFLVWHGYKDGLHGLALSFLQAAYELTVVTKAWEINHFSKEKPVHFTEVTEKEAKNILKNWFWWKKQLQIEQTQNPFKKVGLKILRRLKSLF